MTNEELFNLPGRDNPVLLADGKMGMLVIRPTPTRAEALAGVQVHGEEEHRWLSVADLTASPGGAMRQTGAPHRPPGKPTDPDADLVQVLLAFDWTSRGGLLMPKP